MARITVSLPDDLLKYIDEEARRRCVSRSAWIAMVTSREFSRPDSNTMAKAIARSEMRFRDVGPFEAAEVVRRLRDGAR